MAKSDCDIVEAPVLGLNKEFIRETGYVRWFFRYGWRQFSKRVLHRDNTMRLPTGLRIHLPSYSGNATEIFVTGGNIDSGAEALLASVAAPDDDFLDIGAHIGYYSVYMAPRVHRAYAFEPDPRNLEALRKNAAVADNIRVVELAVSSSTGREALYVGSGAEVGSLQPQSAPSAGGTTDSAATIVVDTTTIDAFAALNPDLRPRLIKTDIEGHDMQALKGMHNTVRAWQPVIVTECGNDPDLAALLAQWNYSLYAFVSERGDAAKRLRSLQPEHLADVNFKMLFLVPPRLADRFDEIAVNPSTPR